MPPKKYLPNFFTQKNPEIENFNPKNPLIFFITCNPEYPPSPGSQKSFQVFGDSEPVTVVI